MPLNTPLVDAAASKDQRLETAWAKAKQLIEQGLANKQIWNTDLETVKYYVGKAMEAAKRPLYEILLDQRKKGESGLGLLSHEGWDAINPWWFSGSVAKSIRDLKKTFPRPNKDGAIYDYIRVLEEAQQVVTSLKELKPFVVKGRKPDPNAKPKDTTNMASCAICGRDQKMDRNSKIVHHGFQISDGMGNYFGVRQGSCFGVGYKPFELSHEANDKYLVMLENELKSATTRLADLSGGRIHILNYTVQVREGYGKYKTELRTAKDTDADLTEWKKRLESAVDQAESDISHLKWEIDAQQKKIASWKPVPVVLNGQTITASGPRFKLAHFQKDARGQYFDQEGVPLTTEQIDVLLAESYKNIGNFYTGEGLKNEADGWYVGVDDNNPDVFHWFFAYKNTPFGMKFFVTGHDGTKEAKRELLQFKQNAMTPANHAYGEASGRILDLYESWGLPKVPAEIAVMVLQGKDVQPMDEYSYTRSISGHPITKIMYGWPKVPNRASLELSSPLFLRRGRAKN